MAIDTENKRASAANFFLFQVPPAPDGSLSAADRSHLDVYSGIATAALNLVVPEPSGALLTLLTADLAVFFNLEEFAETVVYEGTEIDAVVVYGGEENIGRRGTRIGEGSRLKDATLYVKKSDVASPGYLDSVVIDGVAWSVRRVVRDDDDLVWELLITHEERPVM